MQVPHRQGLLSMRIQIRSASRKRLRLISRLWQRGHLGTLNPNSDMESPPRSSTPWICGDARFGFPGPDQRARHTVGEPGLQNHITIQMQAQRARVHIDRDTAYRVPVQACQAGTPCLPPFGLPGVRLSRLTPRQPERQYTKSDHPWGKTSCPHQNPGTPAPGTPKKNYKLRGKPVVSGHLKQS